MTPPPERPPVGRLRSARFGLFDRLGVVPCAEQARPHSVLVQRRTELTVYPPSRHVEERGGARLSTACRPRFRPPVGEAVGGRSVG